MLPNVAGRKATRNQILLYSLPMAAAAMAPFALGETSWLYGGAAIALNLVFLAMAFAVWRNPATDAAAMKPEKAAVRFLDPVSVPAVCGIRR